MNICKIRLRDGFRLRGGGGAFLVKRQRRGRDGMRGGLVCAGWPMTRKEPHYRKALIFNGFIALQSLKLFLSKHLAKDYALSVLK